MTHPTDPGVPPAALRAHAAGVPSLEAAAELLVGHRIWLCRSDFADHFVDLDAHAAGRAAGIDWPAAICALRAGRLPCSGGEARMLEIAASLAEGIPVSLCDTLTGLDQTNAGLTVAAVMHTTGHRMDHR
jgi:hypothetical protein